ncbi:feruloyl-CoA synthase [Thauera chlorobenzoica]|uniref:Fatty acid-CoA ligase n=1 Tax=Thauera chlorobenzoica TaxID=96773 RepID=A0A1H5VUN8_9RHOO|nr:feruloyl-CoA synthase [Thauera chlorobenzoica]APR03940.1 fatty acid-CoA ligase [Thauera chlorobenzoica]SEF90944.1 trans-feruloyl-CoA synthase [Thauera chlorobenzoica]
MSVDTQEMERMFSLPVVSVDRRPDGTQLLRSGIPFPDTYTRCVGDWFEHWAKAAPDRLFLAERDRAGAWVRLSYGEARRRVLAIATWLLGQKLSAERPVVILSDNSIEHALLMLAAMHIGVPSSAISPGNSLMSKDFVKLKGNIELLRPGLIYADPVERFAPALAAIGELHDGVVVAGGNSAPTAGTLPFAMLERDADEAAVMAAFARITPDTIGKFLFTSGSVGTPKAVINTQRMMCSNQTAKALMWPFLAGEPPVLVEWLPWSHTFGSNHNMNMVLRWGGSVYIDDGKPTPALLERTVNNLKEVSPTMYFNVPRAYDMLVPLLREDAALRESFFRRLKFIFYAGAALPHHLWSALEELSEATTGRKVMIVSSWGSTETAPMATDCHFDAIRSGVIGVPIPGTTLKLVPSADKLEVRVKGPNVFPGYWKQPEITAKSFDEEGFYMIGDAVEFVDPARPELGLLFDGRIGEDFKLLTGTWVHVGSLRVAGIDAMKPIAQDIVVTGHDRDEIGFLVFPNIPECRRLCPGLAPDASLVDVLMNPEIRSRIRHGMAMMKGKGGGTSTYPTRALLMAEPPSVEAGEITDKGYINQRIALSRRADLVEFLHADLPDKTVITVHAAI